MDFLIHAPVTHLSLSSRVFTSILMFCTTVFPLSSFFVCSFVGHPFGSLGCCPAGLSLSLSLCVCVCVCVCLCGCGFVCSFRLFYYKSESNEGSSFLSAVSLPSCLTEGAVLDLEGNGRPAPVTPSPDPSELPPALLLSPGSLPPCLPMTLTLADELRRETTGRVPGCCCCLGDVPTGSTAFGFSSFSKSMSTSSLTYEFCFTVSLLSLLFAGFFFPPSSSPSSARGRAATLES
mmetsp:Transcript_31491/g.62218  ORF Transcript_31491/g.62218 Transcript_31491/m.62218 type:complete len:234 (-) Transcript_31491:2676-3377(-)